MRRAFSATEEMRAFKPVSRLTRRWSGRAMNQLNDLRASVRPAAQRQVVSPKEKHHVLFANLGSRP